MTESSQGSIITGTPVSPKKGFVIMAVAQSIGPTTAEAFLTNTSSLAPSIPRAGSPRVSKTVSSTLFPSTPPLPLTLSTAISETWRAAFPTSLVLPLRSRSKPILTVDSPKADPRKTIRPSRPVIVKRTSLGFVKPPLPSRYPAWIGRASFLPSSF